MDKARRNELRNLRWKRRLSNLGLSRKNPKDFTCYRDQGTPCSCRGCSGEKYSRIKFRIRTDQELKEARNSAYELLVP